MNFSRREVEQRTHTLTSPNIQRLYKIQLITIRMLLAACLFFLCFIASLIYGAFRGIIDSVPDINTIQVSPQGYTTTIRDTEGNVLQTLVGRDANREYVTLDRIPSNLQNAFIVI